MISLAALIDSENIDIKSILARKSPIKHGNSYKWHVYKGATKTLATTSGKHLVNLQKGDQIGFRAATSDPNKVRMIHKNLGPTIVFSLSKAHATRIKNNSVPR